MALPVGMIDSSMVRPQQPDAPKPAGQKNLSTDPKQRLMQFCQTKKKGVTTSDIVYTTQQFPFGMQAVVKVVCVDGQEFAGEVEHSAKDAEKSAALQALAAYGVDTTGCMEWKKTAAKRPAAAAPGQPPAAKKPKGSPPVPGTPGVVTPKGELNTMCSRIARSVMDKKSVVYQTGEVVGGGFQSTVTLACLTGMWATQPFAGEVSVKKGDAEQSAATFALAAMKADPELMAKANEPPKAKTWTGKGGGKGGKGKGGGKGGGGAKGGYQQQPQTQILQAQQFSQLGGCGWDAMPHMGGAMNFGFPGAGFSAAGFSGFQAV